MWIITAWQHISPEVTDDDMLWNGSEEDGDIRSECKEDEGTVEMETGTVTGKGT